MKNKPYPKSDPLESFPRKSGQLYCESVSLDELAKKVGTPTYVYSENAIRQTVRRLKSGLEAIPNQICFAMKSNSNPALLKVIRSEGIGVDLVSGGELFLAQAAGFQGNQMVFSGVGKTSNEIRSAIQAGVYSFHVESIAELDLINKLSTQNARVALRFNPNVNPKTHPYISTGLKENKFGIDEKEVLWIAKNHKRWKNLTFSGMSIHIGSQLLSLEPIKEAHQKLKIMVEVFERVSNLKIQYIDIGGGLGIRYKNEKPPSIESFCGLVVREWKSWLHQRPGSRLFLEPGRLITGNSGILLTKVLFRKQRLKKDFLVVDAAMNDLARPSLYQSHHEIVSTLSGKKSDALTKTDIVGPACESADSFTKNRRFPKSWKQGDLLAILSSGAYGYSMASNYNSRLRPAEVLVSGSGFQVIRYRESLEQLLSNIPKDLL